MLTVLAVGGFVMVSAAQSGCSSAAPIAAAPDGGGRCGAGEVAKKVQGLDVCCTASAGTAFDCRVPGAVSAGLACGAKGATTPGDSLSISTDVCVTATCDGDRTSHEFADVTERKQGTLECVQSPAGALSWQWKGLAKSHRVTRACAVTGAIACAAGGYGTYGYSGYGYGGGGNVPKREIVVIASTCTAASGEAPCDVGEL